MSPQTFNFTPEQKAHRPSLHSLGKLLSKTIYVFNQTFTIIIQPYLAKANQMEPEGKHNVIVLSQHKLNCMEILESRSFCIPVQDPYLFIYSQTTVDNILFYHMGKPKWD